jgi:DNA mismatch repair protein MSH3
VMRSSLDARLLALEPVEVIVPTSEMSSATERTIAHYCHAARARLERVHDADIVGDMTSPSDLGASGASLRQIVSSACKSWADEDKDKVLECASSLASYLKQFKLERAMFSAHEYRAYSASREMHIGAEAMRNFEIFHNVNDGGRAGSLLSLLDRTKTPFGSRRIKQWLAHPLTNADAIRDRLDAVECISGLVDGAYESQGGTKGALTPDGCISELIDALPKLPDLDRALARISYKRCTPSAFMAVASAFQRVSAILRALKIATEKSVSQDIVPEKRSPLSAGVLASMIDGVPDIASALDMYVFRRLDPQAATANNYRHLYLRDPELVREAASQEETELSRNASELEKCCQRIAEREESLVTLLIDIRERHSLRKSLEWKHVAQEEYLLEIPIEQAKPVPRTWVVINQTKACKRFRPPEAAKLLQLLEQARELCEEQASHTWYSYLALVSTIGGELRAIVRFLGELDCLAALARLSRLPGYCKPAILDTSEAAGIYVVDGRHPVAEVFLGSNYVPNDVRLGLRNAAIADDVRTDQSQEHFERCMVITGPNMGGKSSFIRMTALIAILAQVGSFVPASSATLSPFDAVYCRMGASDAIGKGMSTLMMELAETSKILEKASDRSLIVLDELGRGTGTHDGTAIAYATLEHLIRSVGSIVLFVTHFPALAKLKDEFFGIVGSYFMNYVEESVEQDDPERSVGHVPGNPSAADEVVKKRRKITFLYKVISGVAQRSYGLNVALLAGLPAAVVDEAAVAATRFDLRNVGNRYECAFRKICTGLSSGNDALMVMAMQDGAVRP